MPSEKFRINTNGQSLRNPSNGFFGMTLSPNLTIDESDVSANNDRRSAHNALERQRREHLNIKFQQLAHALPSLQTVRRPSKTMIVAKSLEFVSSSLKRESNYTSEIQKLREENERLKKQALAASQKLKSQLSDSETTIKVEEDLQDTVTSDNNTSTIKPVKRKAEEIEPSPPPTPEKKRGNKTKTKHAIVINAPNNTKKKRMVKQTKSAPTVQEGTAAAFTSSPPPPPVMIAPFMENHQTYPIQQNTYFDISPPYNPDLLQQFNNYPHEEQQQQQHRIIPGTTNFQPMMNPMLLAPYYDTNTNDFSYNYIHQRQSSNESFYNL